MSSTIAEQKTANAPGPSRTAVKPLRIALKALASLQLTVALFALAVGLVFFGTLAQKGVGIWTVVEQYFWSWVVMVDLQHIVEFGKIFFGLAPDMTVASWARFPFPGGKLIGGLMFANLLAAHALRFKLSWKRSGIFMLHGGILLLFIGEFITREFQVEQQMRIPEGGSANYAVDTRKYELAFSHRLDADTERVTVVPGKQLRDAARNGGRISHPGLPVDIEVLEYLPNSDFISVSDPAAKDNSATAGEGKIWFAISQPEVSGAEVGNRSDLPSLYVRLLKKGTSEQIGTYLVSLMIPNQQLVRIGDSDYGIAYRNVRYYKPFALQLVKFSFDRYVGTDTPKNYSSDLLLDDPEKGQEQRPIKVSMNEPFRHRGETFYQSSFTPDEKTTILQVVRNPGWLLPYISCAMVTIGMLIHFGIGIFGFLTRKPMPQRQLLDGNGSERRANGTNTAREPLTWRFVLLPAIVLGVAGLYVLAVTWPKGREGRMDLRDVGRLPVSDGGRVKPLDTVARVNLRLLNHAEEYVDNSGVTQPAIKWFMEVASNDPDVRSPAAELRVFRIEHDQVRELLKLQRREGLRYSLKEMAPRYAAFLMAVSEAEKRPAKQRDLYEAKLLELSSHIQIFLQIGHSRVPLTLPPTGDQLWTSPARLSEDAALKQLGSAHGGRGHAVQKHRGVALADCDDVRSSSA